MAAKVEGTPVDSSVVLPRLVFRDSASAIGGLNSDSRIPGRRYRASDARHQAETYVETLLAALGPRDPLEVLREMPDALRRALAGLSPAQLAIPEAPGKWSMCKVVQHLSDSELVGAFRFRMILTHDRPILECYGQDLWVERVHRNDIDVEAALAEFIVLRRANVRLIERLTPEERTRVGVHAERGPESIECLIRLFAGHDLVHLRQLAGIRQAVVPAEASR